MPNDPIAPLAEALAAPIKLLTQLPGAVGDALMSGGQQINNQIQRQNPAQELMKKASSAVQAFQLPPPPPLPAATQGGEFYRSPAAAPRTIKAGRAASTSSPAQATGRTILTNIF